MSIKISRFCLSRANTAKIAQYVDRVIDLGKRNLLFRVDVKHLYSIWNMCRTEQDYKYALTATNHFYNFGRQLSPEALDKLFITILRCNQIDEAIQLIAGSSDWLRKPPSLDLIYILMNDLMSKKDFDRLFKVFKTVRNSWQLPLTSTLYNYVISFMLNTEENPLEESLLIYGDSETMGVRLGEETHANILEATLCNTRYNRDMCKSAGMYIINRLFKEVERVINCKTYYLLSWYSFRFKDEKDHQSLAGLVPLARDWKQCLEHSLNMSLLSNQSLEFSKQFLEELGTEAKPFQINGD